MIEQYHFSSVLKKQEVLQFLKQLQTFDEGLTKVLCEELENGNQIIGVTANWPEKGAISVNLSYPFILKNSQQGIRYSSITDSHYGKEQYTSTHSKDSIFC